MRVLRQNQVIDRVGLSKSTMWRLIKAGRFPKPISLGPRAVGWLEDEIESWIASRPRAE